MPIPIKYIDAPKTPEENLQRFMDIRDTLNRWSLGVCDSVARADPAIANGSPAGALNFVKLRMAKSYAIDALREWCAFSYESALQQLSKSFDEFSEWNDEYGEKFTLLSSPPSIVPLRNSQGDAVAFRKVYGEAATA